MVGLFRAGSSLLERFLLESLRELVDVEEAGAANDVLLQCVVHALVLLLQHAGHGTRVTTCTLVLLLVQESTTQGITVPVRGASGLF